MVGGAEHSVYALASGLKETCEVAIFTVDGEYGKRNLSESIFEKVKVYRSGSKRFDPKSRSSKTETFFMKIKNRFADIYNPIALKHFSQILEEFKPDVIHINGLRGIGPQICRIAFNKKIKIVHTLRDNFVIDPIARRKTQAELNSIPLLLWRNFFKHYSKYIDIITSPSAFTLETIQKRGFGKDKQGVVIPNSIVFDQADFLKTFLEKQQIKTNKTRFLFVGALGEYKGILNLIEAFKRSRIENVELVVCGSGMLRSFVEKCAKEDARIIYRGQLSFAEVQKEFKKADVFVLPSLYDEAFGRVVVEAAYNACAIIVSERGGIPEIIKKLGAGIVCDCSVINELSLAMESLCNSDRRNKQLNEFKKNVSCFSQENNINSYKKCYCNIINYNE